MYFSDTNSSNVAALLGLRPRNGFASATPHEKSLGEQASSLSSPLSRIGSLRRTTLALRVTVARTAIMRCLSLLALSGSSCNLWAALQSLGLSDVHLLVRLMWLVAHGRVPVDSYTLSGVSAGHQVQAAEIRSSLAHLSNAIGALAENDAKASRMLLQLCTKVSLLFVRLNLLTEMANILLNSHNSLACNIFL